MSTAAESRSSLASIEALLGQHREWFKPLLKASLQEVLEAEMTAVVGAGPGKRTADRPGRRRGDRVRLTRPHRPVARLHAWERRADARVVGRGHQAGGLAKVVEKAIRGAKEGGSTGIESVYRYAELVTERGLVIMDTHGYDRVASTGQFAGGATPIAFTIGRGSCLGSYPGPTVKRAGNAPMYRAMTGDRDINCGTVIDGDTTLDEMGAAILQSLLEIARAKRSKSESLGEGPRNSRGGRSE